MPFHENGWNKRRTIHMIKPCERDYIPFIFNGSTLVAHNETIYRFHILHSYNFTQAFIWNEIRRRRF